MTTAIRGITLAVDPAVMPAVRQALVRDGIALGEPVITPIVRMVLASAGHADDVLRGAGPARCYHAMGPYHVRRPVPKPVRVDSESAAALAITPRQIRVLRLIAEGLYAPEIGRRLGIAEHVAKTDTRQLFKRLGVHDRAHAIAVAYRLGIFGGAQ